MQEYQPSVFLAGVITSFRLVSGRCYSLSLASEAEVWSARYSVKLGGPPGSAIVFLGVHVLLPACRHHGVLAGLPGLW